MLRLINAQELRLIERLREHPELMERFHSILEISANADGPVKRADGVEGLLIEEMRRLGTAQRSRTDCRELAVSFLSAN
jgi:hypothetical protein